MATKSKTPKTQEPETPAAEQQFRSYNRVQLAGRIVADPELKYTPTGNAVCKLRVATNDTREAQFHDVIVWEAAAEAAAESLTKGQRGHRRGSYPDPHVASSRWFAAPRDGDRCLGGCRSLTPHLSEPFGPEGSSYVPNRDRPGARRTTGGEPPFINPFSLRLHLIPLLLRAAVTLHPCQSPRFPAASPRHARLRLGLAARSAPAHRDASHPRYRRRAHQGRHHSKGDRSRGSHRRHREAHDVRCLAGMARRAKPVPQVQLLNCLLIQSQFEGATRVAGFHAWRKLDRSVRKGEKGIWILAPMTGRVTEDDATDENASAS